MLGQLSAWKFLIAVVVIFGLAVFVSRQYQAASQKCEKECRQGKPVSPSPSSPTENCNKCKENAERNFPRWYRLFGWPEGIGTWAILLTLMAIAEQTYQTRRAADAGKEAARAALEQIRVEKNRERARLVIRARDRPEISEAGPLLKDGQMVIARVSVSNEGPTKAYNVEAYGELLIARDLGGKPHEPGLKQEVRRTIGNTDSGKLPQICVSGLGVIAKEEGFTTTDGMAFDPATIQRIKDREWFFQINGMIQYDDVFGEVHQTPFRFLWRPFGNDFGGAWPDESYWMDLSPPST